MKEKYRHIGDTKVACISKQGGNYVEDTLRKLIEHGKLS